MGTRVSIRSLLVTGLLVLAASGCAWIEQALGGGEEPDATARGSDTAAEGASVLPVAEIPDDDPLLGCDPDNGHPCTLGDVDVEVLAATDEVARAASVTLHAFGAVTAAELLAQHPEVVAVNRSDHTVGFRLEGGRTAWIARTSFDAIPILGSAGTATLPPERPAVPRQAGHAATTASAVEPIPHGELHRVQAGGGGASGVVGEEGEGKRALIVSPFHWEFAPHAAKGGRDSFVTHVRNGLQDVRDYTNEERGGRIDVHANVAPFEGADEHTYPDLMELVDCSTRNEDQPDRPEPDADTGGSAVDRVQAWWGEVTDTTVEPGPAAERTPGWTEACRVDQIPDSYRDRIQQLDFDEVQEIRSLDDVVPSSIESFRSWRDYDAVFVKTHGTPLCSDDRNQICTTGLLSGDGVTLDQDSTDVADDLRSHYGGQHKELLYGGMPRGGQPSVDCQRTISDQIIDNRRTGAVDWTAIMGACTFAVGPARADIVLRPEWFRAEYPDGLDETFVMLASCQGMRHNDYAFLAGDSSIVLGFTENITPTEALRAADVAVSHLEGGRPIWRWVRDIVDQLQGDPIRIRIGGVDDVPLPPAWLGRLSALIAAGVEQLVLAPAGNAITDHGNQAIRGRDVVAVLHPGGGELQDGDRVELEDRGGGPVLPVVLEVFGLDEEFGDDPEGFPLIVRIDGEQVEGSWTASERVEEGVFRTRVDTQGNAEVEVPVPAHVAAGEPFELEVEATIPTGGITKWRYEDLSTQALEIRVRTAWSHTAAEEMSFFGSVLGRAPLETTDDGGYRASVPLGFDEVEVTTVGVPVSCQVGHREMHSTFEVLDAQVDLGSGEVVLDWRVDEGDDQLDVTCGGMSVDRFFAIGGGDGAGNLGFGFGVGAMYVAMDGDAVLSPDHPDAIRVTDFQPSSDEDVLAVFESTSRPADGFTASIWIEILPASPATP